MQDVDVGHSLGLEVSLQLRAPLGQEVVLGPELLVGLLLGLQLSAEHAVLKLVGSLGVSEVGFEFVDVELEALDLLLVVVDLLVEAVLLSRVVRLQFLHLLAVQLPQPADLLEQVGDLSVLERDLGSEDLRFVVLGLHGRVQVVQLGLGVLLDLLHRSGIVLEGLVPLGLHSDDLLGKHLD